MEEEEEEEEAVWQKQRQQWPVRIRKERMETDRDIV